MFKSLKMKIMAPIVAIFLLLAIIVITAVSVTTENLVNELLEKRAEANAESARSYLQQLEEYTQLLSYSMSLRANIIYMVDNDDIEGLHQYLENQVNSYDIDSFVVTDCAGNIIFGDADMLLPFSFNEEISSAYISDAVYAMALASVAPIFDVNERTIGYVISKINMATEEFVSELARTLNDSQVVVFSGSERVATTVTDDPSRAVGTFAADDIVEAVINQGEPWQLTLPIDGTVYYSFYLPLFSADGEEVIGMFFVGYSNEREMAAVKALQGTLIVLVMLGLLVAVAIMLAIMIRFFAPLEKLTQSVSQISQSDFDDIKVFGGEYNDEIGKLSHAIQLMLDNLRAKNTNLRKATKEIVDRDILISAVNQSVSELLEADYDNFNEALIKSLGIIGDALDVNRVYIWKNHEEDNVLCCTQIMEWHRGVPSSMGSKHTVKVPYHVLMPKWEKELARGQGIKAIVSQMSKDEQYEHMSLNIKSFMVIPVYVHDEFWGFVGFDDCENERRFTDNEESILRAGSLLVVNALLRNNAMKALEAALEKAKAASLAKTTFLSNMSHEIRTPMNAIVGMAAIGKSAPETIKKDYAFEKIEIASTHLLGVINDVLDMSKIEADKFELSEVDFSFEKMVRNVVDFISFRMEMKNQELSVKLDTRIPACLIGDDQRLAQVISNLLSNSVKFTPEGGRITLTANLLSEQDGLCTIEVQVTDTGIGIEKENQNKLFQSFEQAESTISRTYGGTGLGLAISKRVVELMQGNIGVESEPDKGSTFTFVVKLQKCDKEYVEAPAINKDGLRVLLVDDDLDLLEYFKTLTNKLGIIGDVASNGFDALKLIEARDVYYNICFVDWRMPEMSGSELTKKMRDFDNNGQVIIITSALDWGTIESEARENGASAFLPKPLFLASLAECINKYCNGVPKPSEEKTDANGAVNFKDKHILLAEDIDINREIVMSLLEATEIKIDAAENGQELIAAFTAQPEKYDLILMDIQMPLMDGFEATRNIREMQNPSAKKIPIIAMTANAFKEDVDACLSAGMNDHIAKPIDFEVLISKLRKYLRG
jgi:signal transduction histidine kinase/DNA-binding response OmpR family regulator/HAMP domain-containing protein